MGKLLTIIFFTTLLILGVYVNTAKEINFLIYTFLWVILIGIFAYGIIMSERIDKEREMIE